MNGSSTYPVQVLREHVTGLEAAISVCLADPDHKPVHKLRTETRRVEALLVLLGLMPGLPEHRKEASAMLRALTKLRRMAGEVRDLDVHRNMLETLAEAEQAAAEPDSTAVAANGASNGNDTGKSKVRPAKRKAKADDPEASASPDNAALLSRSAAELRKSLGRDRDRAASHLVNVLKDRQAKTARAAEALLDVLEPATDLALPATDLLRDAEALLTRDGLLRGGNISKLDEDELHTVRKAAKKARYLAESLPSDATVAAAAQRFEMLQEAGGQWHDALELARAARRYFGKGHELTATYRAERDAKLELYRAALAANQEPAKTKTAKPKPAESDRRRGSKPSEPQTPTKPARDGRSSEPRTAKRAAAAA